MANGNKAQSDWLLFLKTACIESESVHRKTAKHSAQGVACCLAT
jgi:hypothetical protein